MGLIAPPTLEAIRAPLLDWLRSRDPQAVSRAELILAPAATEPLLERVVAVAALGLPELADHLGSWREPSAPPPVAVPALLRDPELPTLIRANLTLWYARDMAQRRLHQETLDALALIRPEEVVDPAAFYFFRGVSEAKLRKRDEALASLNRLQRSVAGVPDRYRFIAELLLKDLNEWKEKDLGDISRRMQEIEGRLHNARGGPQTQERQKEVIALLDELIKDIEDQCNQNQGGGGASGSQDRVAQPMPDSRIVGGQAGKGEVDKKPLIKDNKVWGQMPEKDKVKAMEDISRELPPHFKEAIEAYSRRIAGGNSPPKE